MSSVPGLTGDDRWRGAVHPRARVGWLLLAVTAPVSRCPQIDRVGENAIQRRRPPASRRSVREVGRNAIGVQAVADRAEGHPLYIAKDPLDDRRRAWVELQGVGPSALVVHVAVAVRGDTSPDHEAALGLL